jgi:hypothetical protein
MTLLNVFLLRTALCHPLMRSAPRIQGKKLADISKFLRPLANAIPSS